ncbi:hypothetical protein QYE76_042986 [Lolium multiflorum]|uniref:Reverse transcriptase n=1 Tax=Lolium multiflorum TaxID=4521 RepID=A0AAD8THW9_LOLMU|nr:hypothetical protein QYE76_042986 [Lolium multiflorum]
MEDQRCNIFQTRAGIGGKSIKVIIDGGSCHNLASTELCEKLNLTLRKHPHPYHVQWLSDKGNVKIQHIVTVNFKIGPYEDIIECDVVPMTVCYMLLGRPWQFDKKAIHDGYSNAYTFKVKDKKFELRPMTPSQIIADNAKALARHNNIPTIEFQDVFPDELPHGLPPLRGIEHRIDLIPGAPLPNRAAYRTNPKDTKEIQRQIQDLLAKGYVRESLSPCAVPVILVPKPDEMQRMCMYCRPINAITVRYRHPIPRLDDMLDELSGATIFSKIDLRSGYHQIRMAIGDEWKTAFKTKLGLYEWLVMPFGLSNAPSTFMRLMNHILRPLIGKSVVVYFDDILIYSKTLEDHVQHVREVLCILRHEKLFANLPKCTFAQNKLVFLGFVVSANGIEVDSSKVDAIHNWPTPTTVGQVRSFHGLAGFYRRFVKDFSTIACPLNELTKKNVPFVWGKAQQNAFDELKKRLTEAPLLVLPNFAKTFEIECDASGLGIGGVLMQDGKPVAYYSEKLDGARLNYPIYDKELYALCSVDRGFDDFYLHDGYLFKANKVCIPESSLRKLLLQESHGGGLMGHFGRDKTLSMLSTHYYWPRMKRDVERLCNRCTTCLQAKEVVRLHGIPASIVSDRDVKFMSYLWKSLMAKFGVKLLFSSSSHPQTDGQTEVVNRSLSTLLRTLVKKNLKSWEDCLPHAEFAYNRAKHSTTSRSPFMIVYGFEPPTALDILPLPLHERTNMDFDKRTAAMKQLHEDTRATIQEHVLRQATRLNAKKKERVFEEGDLVWIHLRKERFPQERNSKLKPRGDGPFKVLKRINNNAYVIDIPTSKYLVIDQRQGFKKVHQTEATKEKVRQKWSPPESNEAKLNVDGAFSGRRVSTDKCIPAYRRRYTMAKESPKWTNNTKPRHIRQGADVDKDQERRNPHGAWKKEEEEGKKRRRKRKKKREEEALPVDRATTSRRRGRSDRATDRQAGAEAGQTGPPGAPRPRTGSQPDGICEERESSIPRNPVEQPVDRATDRPGRSRIRSTGHATGQPHNPVQPGLRPGDASFDLDGHHHHHRRYHRANMDSEDEDTEEYTEHFEEDASSSTTDVEEHVELYTDYGSASIANMTDIEELYTDYGSASIANMDDINELYIDTCSTSMDDMVEHHHEDDIDPTIVPNMFGIDTLLRAPQGATMRVLMHKIKDIIWSIKSVPNMIAIDTLLQAPLGAASNMPSRMSHHLDMARTVIDSHHLMIVVDHHHLMVYIDILPHMIFDDTTQDMVMRQEDESLDMKTFLIRRLLPLAPPPQWPLPRHMPMDSDATSASNKATFHGNVPISYVSAKKLYFDELNAQVSKMPLLEDDLGGDGVEHGEHGILPSPTKAHGVEHGEHGILPSPTKAHGVEMVEHGKFPSTKEAHGDEQVEPTPTCLIDELVPIPCEHESHLAHLSESDSELSDFHPICEFECFHLEDMSDTQSSTEDEFPLMEKMYMVHEDDDISPCLLRDGHVDHMDPPTSTTPTSHEPAYKGADVDKDQERRNPHGAWKKEEEEGKKRRRKRKKKREEEASRSDRATDRQPGAEAGQTGPQTGQAGAEAGQTGPQPPAPGLRKPTGLGSRPGPGPTSPAPNRIRRV